MEMTNKIFTFPSARSHLYTSQMKFHRFESQCVDSNARGLECGAIQWHGKNKSLGCIIFRCIDDVWQLCAIQFVGCYSGGRLQLRGKKSDSSTTWEREKIAKNNLLQ